MMQRLPGENTKDELKEILDPKRISSQDVAPIA